MKNTLKIKGIKAACSATKDLTGRYGTFHVEIYYDLTTGALITHELLRQNSVRYETGDVTFVADVSNPTSMSEIKELVERALAEREASTLWLKQVEEEYANGHE